MVEKIVDRLVGDVAEMKEQLAEISGQLKQLVAQTHQSSENSIEIARLEASLKSAHKRIDELRSEIYRNVSIAIGAITFIFWLLERAGK